MVGLFKGYLCAVWIHIWSFERSVSQSKQWTDWL